jgi:hypothetical protein
VDTSEVACTYPHAPPGFTEDGASSADLEAAGFRRGDGERPADAARPRHRFEVLRDAEGNLRQTRFRVLLDPAGSIVATWGEGRWWTQDEFARRFLAERPSPAAEPGGAPAHPRRVNWAERKAPAVRIYVATSEDDVASR